MLTRTLLIAPLLTLAVPSYSALAQDLSTEAAAKERLHQRQRAQSKQILDYLLEKNDWTYSASTITSLYGMTFDDDLVAPLLARTDTSSTGAQRNLTWHAIAYTNKDFRRGVGASGHDEVG